MWGPGLPLALAQVEVDFTDPQLDAACRAEFATLSPDLAKECTNILETCQAAEEPDASPEAKAEAEGVTATVEAIHGATETIKQVLADSDAVATATVAALTDNGVPPAVVATTEAQLKDALAKAKESLQGGATLGDVAKYLEDCQKALADCSGYLGGKDFKEIFTTSGGTGELRTADFCGAVLDPSQRDVIAGCMEAHFKGTVQEVLRGAGPEGVGVADQMREVMASMMASGVNPSEVMRGGTGEMATPPKEVLDAMSPTDRAMFEAWKSGDTATMEAAYREAAMKAGMEAGMTPEGVQHEMATMEFYREMEASMTPEQKEVMMKELDPRTESSGTSETTATKATTDYADGHGVCPDGTTHQGGVEQGPGHCL